MNLMAAGERRAALPKRHSKILIVDDDADLSRALGLRLRANHFETLSAGDGYSALSLAQAEQPDLVLLDLGLPGFATGASVLKHMRTFSSLASIPVIVLTGRDLRDYKQSVLELGVAGCFQKPFDNEELLDLICRCLQPHEKRPDYLRFASVGSRKRRASKRRRSS
jgi:two-component system KDP operon response regulator KdpE